MQREYTEYAESNRDELIDMIRSLYRESGADDMHDEKIVKTIGFLVKNPSHGKIVMISEGSQTIGYSILINFWSNEFGGLILIIDELFVRKEFRNKGVGSAFITHLCKEIKHDYVGLELEVYPYNDKALQLYTRLGFKKTPNHFLRLIF